MVGNRKTAAPWLRRVVTLVLIPPACIGAYYVGQLLAVNRSAPGADLTPPQSGPVLYVAPESLALGEVWESAEHAVKLVIENWGNQPTDITDIGTSCECSSVTPRALSIPPGGSATITVKMDLFHRLPYHMGLERRPLSVRLDPVFKDMGRPVEGWEIKGIVRSRVSLEKTRLHFDDKCLQYGPAASRKMLAVAHIPIKTLKVVGNADIADVRVEPINGKTGHFAIVVTPNPTQPIGIFRFDVSTMAIGMNDEQHLCANFTVFGEMLPPARIVPGILLLGEHVIGQTATAEVSIRLPNREGWMIDHIEIDSGDTSVARVENVNGKSLRYAITQTINEPGDQTRTIRFVLRDPNGKAIPCNMKVIYHGNPKVRTDK